MINAISTIQSDQLFWILIAVGVLTGICSILFISILSSWAMKETLDRALPLLIFAIITGTSVYAIGSLVVYSSQQSQASSRIQITDWQIREMDSGTTEVRFRTSAPSHVYLEYKTASGDSLPIFSGTSSEKVTEHRFSTDRPVSKDGILSVIIEGSKYVVTQ